MGRKDCYGAIKTQLKNDRYPFYYPRDSTRIAMAYDKLGFHDKVDLFYNFMKKLQFPNGEWVQRYQCHTLKPVVTRAKESDCVGIVLSGIADHYNVTKDKRFIKRMWGPVMKGLGYLHGMSYGGMVYSRHSIHENPTVEEGFEIWVNSWACRAYRDIAEVAKELNKHALHRNLETKYKKLKTKIDKKFWNGTNYSKLLRTDGTNVDTKDITMISPAWVGIVPWNDDKIKKTVRYLRSLWDRKIGGYNRFNKLELIKDWHWYDGGGGPWTLYTIIMAKAHHELKQVEHEEKCLRWLRNIIRTFGSLPEHIAEFSDFKQWKYEECRSQVNVTPWLMTGMRQGENNVTSWKWNSKRIKVVPWVKSIVWPKAELILNLNYKQLQYVVNIKK